MNLIWIIMPERRQIIMHDSELHPEHVHEHEHDHEHTHEHVHGHEHTHEHSHQHGGFDSIEQAIALMTYMLDHNRHHAEELHQTCHKLEDMDYTSAAEKLGQALNCYNEGNNYLAEALEALKEAK